jgi:hypothetical protein
MARKCAFSRPIEPVPVSHLGRYMHVLECLRSRFGFNNSRGQRHAATRPRILVSSVAGPAQRKAQCMRMSQDQTLQPVRLILARTKARSWSSCGIGRFFGVILSEAKSLSSLYVQCAERFFASLRMTRSTFSSASEARAASTYGAFDAHVLPLIVCLLMSEHPNACMPAYGPRE